jgi:hypothetical protein
MRSSSVNVASVQTTSAVQPSANPATLSVVIGAEPDHEASENDSEEDRDNGEDHPADRSRSIRALQGRGRKV